MKIEKIYLKSGGGEAGLTCYLKENTEGLPKARRPAVIVCPGGGYGFCSTREAEPVVMQFLAMDCQVFLLNYSTAPAVFPASLLELSEAVALVREHAGQWHVCADRVAVCGFSAGGHLAACLGVFWNRDFLTKSLKVCGEQIRPDGLILAYPVISSGSFGHQGSFDSLLGEKNGQECTLTGAPGFTREFLSLELQAGSQVPPVFMWHTDTDQTVPVENSLLFAMALKKAGVSLELHIFPEGRHGLALADEETDKEADDGRGTYIVPCCQSWLPLARIWLKQWSLSGRN